MIRDWPRPRITAKDADPAPGRFHVHNAADFRRFIEGPRPEGCQTPIHVLRHMVKGSDVEDAVEELLRGTPGAPKDFVESRPRNDDGSFASIHNRNDVTVMDSEPVVIPMPTAEKPVRKRDYARESKQGTSTGYTLRLLEKQAPEYLERVKAGEMSPHGAAVKAGRVAKNQHERACVWVGRFPFCAGGRDSSHDRKIGGLGAGFGATLRLTPVKTVVYFT